MNKRIAELKGLCWHEFPEEAPTHQRCIHCGVRRVSDYPDEPLVENPDWENNIADAWGLLKEIRYGQIDILEAIIAKIKQGHKLTDKIFCDTICKAYTAGEGECLKTE